MNLVEVSNLRKSYGDYEVLHGVSFSVKAGEIFSLLGQNGAGKTTTLNIIEGLTSDYSGDARVFEQDIRHNTKQHQRQIGVQLQSTALIPDLSVLEQIKMFAGLYQQRITHQQALDLLDRFQLADKAKSRPDRLSGGEKQRLTLALALVNTPQLLILDEPTAGLDVQSREMLWKIIKAWHNSDRAIILTTHHIEEAERLAHRVAILHNGAIVALDTPQALISQLDADTLITIDGAVPQPLLDGLTNDERITLENGFTRIYTRQSSRTIVQLVTNADKLSIALGNWRIQHPTLEAVFLAHTSDKVNA